LEFNPRLGVRSSADHALSPAKLGFIHHAFMAIKRAFRAILAALTGRWHSANNGVDPGPHIRVGAVCHQRDLVAGRELVFRQWAALRNVEQNGAAHETPPEELARLKIDGGGFTLLATLQVEADRLTLVQSLEPCALDRRDMDEHVLGSVGRLNETETLLGVKPFYCT
jgi:hypothetical protein